MRPAFVLLLIVLACSAPARGAPVITLEKKSRGEYLISAPGLTSLRLQFLSSRSFRIAPWKSSLPSSLPELMVVQSSFPGVDTADIPEENGHRIRAGELELVIA